MPAKVKLAYSLLLYQVKGIKGRYHLTFEIIKKSIQGGMNHVNEIEQKEGSEGFYIDRADDRHRDY